MNATSTAIDQVKEGVRNWHSDCLKFATVWIRTQSVFTSEDLIQAFNDSHDFRPAESRVWGSVVRELIRAGLITRYGYGTYKGEQGHSKPTNIWKTV
mgnify:FL=1